MVELEVLVNEIIPTYGLPTPIQRVQEFLQQGAIKKEREKRGRGRIPLALVEEMETERFIAHAIKIDVEETIGEDDKYKYRKVTKGATLTRTSEIEVHDGGGINYLLEGSNGRYLLSFYNHGNNTPIYLDSHESIRPVYGQDSTQIIKIERLAKELENHQIRPYLESRLPNYFDPDYKNLVYVPQGLVTADLVLSHKLFPKQRDFDLSFSSGFKRGDHSWFTKVEDKIVIRGEQDTLFTEILDLTKKPSTHHNSKERIRSRRMFFGIGMMMEK